MFFFYLFSHFCTVKLFNFQHRVISNSKLNLVGTFEDSKIKISSIFLYKEKQLKKIGKTRIFTTNHFLKKLISSFYYNLRMNNHRNLKYSVFIL